VLLLIVALIVGYRRLRPRAHGRAGGLQPSPHAPEPEETSARPA
jgi:hypothetical protein